MDFGRILNYFWHHFSSSISDGFPSAIREGFWTNFGSKSIQNRPSHFCLPRLVSDLGASWGSRWPPELPRGLQEGPRGLQEGPRGLQEGPRGLQEGLMASIFGRFRGSFDGCLLSLRAELAPKSLVKIIDQSIDVSIDRSTQQSIYRPND